jgi:hypothetical protein
MCLVLLTVAGIMVFADLDSLWSQSVDLAHHYALTYRIAEQFHLMDWNDPTLGEMNYYPRLSHIFAAILGWPLNSSLLGIQVVTLLSFSAIWGGFLYILNTLPKPLGLLSTISLAGLLFLNKLTFKFEVHGSEIVSNFFYSQLVAQGIIVLAIAAAIVIEIKRGRWAAYALLIGVIAIDTGVHLLPTLELLGMLLALVLVNMYQDIAQKERRLAIIMSLAVPVIALGGVILNPAFSAMRKIAENDGGLEFRFISYPFGLGTLCVIALLISAALLRVHVRSNSRFAHPTIKYLALYGAAVSGLCLLQMTLVQFGFGSNYAVKKYGFGIISYLFIIIAILAGQLTLRALPKKWTYLDNYHGLDALVVGCALLVALKSVIMPYKVIDFSELLQLEKRLISITTTEVEDIPGKTNAVIGLKGYYPTFNYMFSLALTNTPRSLAIPDILLADKLHDYSNYGYIVSSAGSAKYDMSECELTQHGGITINSAKCISEQLKQSGVCKNTVDFSHTGTVETSSISGFDGAEEEGRWIKGKVATYTCDIPNKAPKKLEIEMFPLLTASLKSQRIRILANDQPIYDAQISNVSNEVTSLDLPPLGESGKMVIKFETPDATSPKELGVGQDARPLGFFIKTIRFRNQ